jgi:gas vesicle protein
MKLKSSIFLTIVFLIATYEHCYFTLSGYSHNLMLWSLNWSVIANILLVAGVDFAIFFGVKNIPGKKSIGVTLTPTYLIVGLMTIVSVLLNVKYMILVDTVVIGWNFETIIGVLVGLIIPTAVILLAIDEGQTSNRLKEIEIEEVEQEKERWRKMAEEKRKTENFEKVKRIEEGLAKKRGGNGRDSEDLYKAIKQFKNQNKEMSERAIAGIFSTSQSTVNRALNSGDNNKTENSEYQ